MDPRTATRAGTVVAMLAVVAAIASLWPDARLPAWPAASLGIAAFALAWGRGPVGASTVAGLVGAAAALVGGAQIAVLWGISRALG